MKKAIVVVSLLAANLIADCTKMDINEIRYMDKNELQSKYKWQYSLYKTNSDRKTQYLDEAAKISEDTLEGLQKKGKIMQTAIKYSTEAICYIENGDNIGRVLKKDFSFTDADLEKLK